MKRTIILALLAMLTISSRAQVIPEGATLLYHSETRRTVNGLYLTHFTLFEQSGKIFMRRIRGFAGAASPILSKQDKIYYLPEVTFELSKSQVSKIKSWLRESPIGALSEPCAAEIVRYAPPKNNDSNKLVLKGGPWGMNISTHYCKIIEWPGVLTGVSAEYDVESGDYNKEEFKQRIALGKAVADIDEKLEEIGYKYVKKNINKLWGK